MAWIVNLNIMYNGHVFLIVVDFRKWWQNLLFLKWPNFGCHLYIYLGRGASKQNMDEIIKIFNYTIVKSRSANSIPTMIYSLFKQVQKFCHRFISHKSYLLQQMIHFIIWLTSYVWIYNGVQFQLPWFIVFIDWVQ